MPGTEMVVFTRTFDLLAWLLPITDSFPRAHRHTATKRLLDAAFDFQELIEAANHRRTPERLAKLSEADEALDRLRLYLRLSRRWQWLSDGQYRHVASMVTEIGKLLGGWVKAAERDTGNLRRSASPVAGAVP